jgi:cell division protein FtsN
VVSFSDEPKKVSLAAFSTAKLITIAATLVLFISLVGMFNSPVGTVNLKAQGPAEAAVRATENTENEVEQKTANAPSEVTSIPAVETSKPTPSASPVVSQENISEVATLPANPPVVNEPTVNQPAVNEPLAINDGGLSIQVGSHNQMVLADGQAEKLRAKGYDPRVVSVEIPKRGRWYRVQVGRFSDRQEAQRFGAQLVSKGVVESFVIADK